MGNFATPISPVLEAFLAGQRQQNETQSLQTQKEQKAQELALQKEHIDALVKEIDQRHQEAQATHDLAVKQFGVNLDIAREQQRQGLIKQASENPQAFSQMFNLPNVSAPGAPNLNLPVSIPGFNIQPQPGDQVTQDLGPELGKVSFGMPESAMAQAGKLAQAKAEGELPSQLKLIDANTSKALAVANIRAEYEKAASEQREKAAEYGANSRMAVELEKERNQLLIMMNQNFGPETAKAILGGQGGVNDEIMRHAVRIGQGDENIEDVPKFIQGGTKTALSQLGINVPAIGSKQMKANILSFADNGNRLLNAFDEFSKKHPATDNPLTGLAKYGASAPLINNFTDLGQDTKLYGANVAALANTVSETPGMMRSPLLAQKGMALGPTGYDKTSPRLQKKVDTADMIFTNISKAIDTLGPIQKADYWQEVFDRMPDLKNNAKWAPILSKIKKTGSFSSDMLNPLKNQ